MLKLGQVAGEGDVDLDLGLGRVVDEAEQLVGDEALHGEQLHLVAVGEDALSEAASVLDLLDALVHALTQVHHRQLLRLVDLVQLLQQALLKNKKSSLKSRLFNLLKKKEEQTIQGIVIDGTVIQVGSRSNHASLRWAVTS